MPEEPSPADRIASWATAYWRSQALYVAARLGVADELAAGPQDPASLAARVGADGDALYRLLRALAGDGLFEEDEAGRFHLTALGEPLRDDAADSRRALILMMGEEHFRAWGDLLETVRGRGTAFDRVFGKPVFDHLAAHPEQARVFDRAMVEIHGAETPAILDVYDLSGAGTIADIGGGNGSLLRAALARHPGARGVLFDLPAVAERARHEIAADGLDGRCAVVGGDFFADVPVTADVYLLRHIIHDWPDEPAAAILDRVARAMPPGARLLILEKAVPPGNEPSFIKWLDLNMMAIPGGKERTEAEYRRLLADAGLAWRGVRPTIAEADVIEAERVE